MAQLAASSRPVDQPGKPLCHARGFAENRYLQKLDARIAVTIKGINVKQGGSEKINEKMDRIKYF